MKWRRVMERRSDERKRCLLLVSVSHCSRSEVDKVLHQFSAGSSCVGFRLCHIVCSQPGAGLVSVVSQNTTCLCVERASRFKGAEIKNMFSILSSRFRWLYFVIFIFILSCVSSCWRSGLYFSLTL